MYVFYIGHKGTFVTKIASITWYINTQVTSSSKPRIHVDIQERSNVERGIYVCVCGGGACVCVYIYIHIHTHTQVVRINRWLNYETDYTTRYRYLVHTLGHVSIQFQM
jgi:hypothetical protein